MLKLWLVGHLNRVNQASSTFFLFHLSPHFPFPVQFPVLGKGLICKTLISLSCVLPIAPNTWVGVHIEVVAFLMNLVGQWHLMALFWKGRSVAYRERDSAALNAGLQGQGGGLTVQNERPRQGLMVSWCCLLCPRLWFHGHWSLYQQTLKGGRHGYFPTVWLLTFLGDLPSTGWEDRAEHRSGRTG